MKYAMSGAIIIVLATVLLAGVVGSGSSIIHAQDALSTPENFTVINGPNPGEVIMTWDAVDGAAWYRVGWINIADLNAEDGTASPELHIHTDVKGKSSYTATRLTPGEEYFFTVAAKRTQHSRPSVARMVRLTVNADGASCPAAGSASPPTGISVVTDAANPGTATVRWEPPADGSATWYRIGWGGKADYPDGLVYFVVAAEGSGTQAHTVTGLKSGTEYVFAVASKRTLDGAASPSQIVVQVMPGGDTFPPMRDGDYDADNDGLIEIRNLVQLDAIRYDLDGDGAATDANGRAAYSAAFPNAATGMGCAEGCTGYELVTDLDFGTDISGAGWLPIGQNYNHSFNATFDGNGHTISNLFIGRGDTYYIGLFGYVGNGSAIRRVGLESVTVTGGTHVGGLVGVNGYSNNSAASISDSYVTGNVIGNSNVGGLVGYNRGIITESYATSVLSGGGTIGGLVGYSESGTITDSYATGSITNSGANSGGLVGGTRSGVVITDSYATGNVTGQGDDVGGLLGSAGPNTTITASNATGDVSGSGDYSSDAGGLVGWMGTNSTITGSYASGNVSGNHHTAGGLVGLNGGGIINVSYSTGRVTNGYESGYYSHTGGLVGHNNGILISGYATGSASGHGKVGGLIGVNKSTVTAAYSISRVVLLPTESDPDYAVSGGLVGLDDGGTVNASYWNTQTSGQTNSDGGIGKTTEELRGPIGAVGIYATWNAAWWDFGNSNQYPVLKYGSLSVSAQR